MKNNIKSAKGFTLVEMLGVLAIIAILISVISVGVLAAINRARIVSTLSNFKNLETATLAYVAMPESSGQIPLTKATSISTVQTTLANSPAGTALALAAQTDLHLEAIYMQVGTLERYPQWRAGTDAMQSGNIDLQKERAWNRKMSKWSEENVAGAGTFGNNWIDCVRAECAVVDQAAIPGTYNANGMMGATGVNFYLDGNSDLPQATRCAYVVLPGLSLKDAEKISEEINGALNTMDIKNNIIVQTGGRFVTDGTQIDGAVTGYFFLANQ